ncbi:hypothetical protein A7985_18980 [Pseudoalteromonas luteoviolacea]|uniref:Uncharacterized protein n=1 Tax=Pseudoalteromonas luteoviolacea TaxID=43657 RepID=A0A1C0TMC8_9GAMM|nr:hypothetical protein A7985_18980 [Pseudoalteromonas luteoviolacea]
MPKIYSLRHDKHLPLGARSELSPIKPTNSQVFKKSRKPLKTNEKIIFFIFRDKLKMFLFQRSHQS